MTREKFEEIYRRHYPAMYRLARTILYDADDCKDVVSDIFARLQELFRFGGIPHYETITPDCRRVRDDLQVQSFYNFDNEMERLKEKLK